MAVIGFDGFDLYNGTGTNTGVQAKWTPTNIGSPTLQTGRFSSGQCLRATTTTSGSTNGGGNYQRALGQNVTSGCAGFAFRSAVVSDNRSAGSVIFGFALAGVGVQCSIGVDVSGKIVAWRGNAATLLGTSSSAVILPNTWHYIEVEAVIDGTVGRITVYVDSIQALNLTSQNTKAQTSAGADVVQILVDGALAVANGRDFDDMYFLNAASKLGEGRVETERPAADSTKVWTPNSGVTNFSRVNEATVDGDTSYVQSSNVGDRDLYTVSALSSLPTTIYAVQISSFAEKTDATARTFYNSCQSAGTDSDGSAFALNASYGKFERLLLTDPNGGGAWTASRVNGLLIGPKVAS